RAGRWKSVLRRPRGREAWTSTKCAVGRGGTGTSRWRCWPTPTSPPCERKRRPATREKKGRPGKRHRLAALLPLTVPEVRRRGWGWGLVWGRVLAEAGGV